MINAKHIAQLPQLFRGPFLRKVAASIYFNELSERLELCGLSDLLELRLLDILEAVYKILQKQYRSEYVFKNAITQQCLSSFNTWDNSFLTDEFRVGKSRVDLAVFSNTSTAYEIKTEYDSAFRLPSQTMEYIKVFDLVYVVTSAKFRPKIEQSIPESVGLLELSDAGGLSVFRKSRSHSNLIDLHATFDCLRQEERIAIVEMLSKTAVDVPRSHVYRECKKRFRKLLPYEAHQHLLFHLRMRKYSSASEALMKQVPSCLKHAVLTLRASNREIELIKSELLKEPRKTKPKKIQNPNEHLFPISSREAERIACA